MTKNEIEKHREALNLAIANLELGSEPAELYEPIKYMLSLGGKRMRPLLTLLAYDLIGNDIESAVKPALAVEVFHNFTLIHDDIMDDAPIRRGSPTVYKKWDKNIAILSGDAMLVKAYDLLLESPPESISQVLKLFNKCALEVCEGQQLDMNFETIDHVSEEEYIHMIRLKTAVLLGFSLELGGLIGGMTGDESAKLRQFGINMGIGFQLKDDILDVYGDQEKFGKQVGGDIIANKKTYLLIKALELANKEQKLALINLLDKADFIPEEKVSKVKQVYDDIGIQSISESKMNQYFDAAFSDLEELNVNPEKLKFLEGFTKALINRES